MSLHQQLNAIAQILSEGDGLTSGHRAIMQWLEIWYLSPGKRSYLERAGREDLIELAAPLQGILEDPDDQRAFPAELEGRGITSLETFLNHLYN